MSGKCEGINKKGKQCSVKVKAGKYCRFHKQKSPVKMVLITKPQQVIESNTIVDPCSICLCEVDPSEDCMLECLHPHHIECAKMLSQNACPVCRKELHGKNFNPNMIAENIKKANKEMEVENSLSTTELTRNLNIDNVIQLVNNFMRINVDIAELRNIISDILNRCDNPYQCADQVIALLTL